MPNNYSDYDYWQPAGYAVGDESKRKILTPFSRPLYTTLNSFDIAQVWTPESGNLRTQGSSNNYFGGVYKISKGLEAIETPSGVGYVESSYVGGYSVDAHVTIAVIRRTASFSSFVRNVTVVGNTAIQIHNNNNLFYVTNAGATAFAAPITNLDDWHVVVFRRKYPSVEIFVSLFGGTEYTYQSNAVATSARPWVTQGTMRIGCASTANEHPYTATALVFSLVGHVPDDVVLRYLRNPFSIIEAPNIVAPIPIRLPKRNI